LKIGADCHTSSSSLPSIVGALLNITSFTGFAFSGGSAFTGFALRPLEVDALRPDAAGLVSRAAVDAAA